MKKIKIIVVSISLLLAGCAVNDPWSGAGSGNKAKSSYQGGGESPAYQRYQQHKKERELEEFRRHPERIDRCAKKIAYGETKKPGFNSMSDWPAYCHNFHSKPKVQERAKEILATLKRLALPAEKEAKIKRGVIWVGATKEMAELSWGIPKRINKTTTANTISEQWVYGNSYLYFDNGKITAIQN